LQLFVEFTTITIFSKLQIVLVQLWPLSLQECFIKVVERQFEVVERQFEVVECQLEAHSG